MLLFQDLTKLLIRIRFGRVFCFDNIVHNIFDSGRGDHLIVRHNCIRKKVAERECSDWCLHVFSGTGPTDRGYVDIQPFSNISKCQRLKFAWFAAGKSPFAKGRFRRKSGRSPSLDAGYIYSARRISVRWCGCISSKQDLASRLPSSLYILHQQPFEAGIGNYSVFETSLHGAQP